MYAVKTPYTDNSGEKTATLSTLCSYTVNFGFRYFAEMLMKLEQPS